MTKMKNSGIDWIGEIPEEWGVVRLKDCITINNGRDYKDVEVSENGFPVIGSGGQFAYASKYLYDGVSILLGRKGTVDKPLYVEGKFWTVDTMFYCIPKKTVNAKFIYYVALQIPFDFYSTNTALPSMTQSDLQNHHFGIPSLSEQSQIADYLDKKVAQLDKAKALLEEQIATLQDYRQSLIYETVTKGLDKTAPLKDSGVDWIGQIPEGWMKTRFKYFINLKSGENYINDEFNEGIYPVLGGGNKVLGAYNRYNVDENNIIIGRVGSAGLVTKVLAKSFATDNALIVETKEIKDFIYYLLDSSNLPQLSTSNAQPLITATKILNQFSVLPDREEQQRISDYLNEKTDIINKMIAIKQEQIENINQQRQTLIYDFVTGKRRV